MIFFFFKQKTAYDMRISDWSSDVCSSDLGERAKNGVAHLVPLSGDALVLLPKGPADIGDKLFPARGNSKNGPSGFSKAIKRIRAAMEEQMEMPVPHWTLHDLRRTNRKSTRLNSSH